MKKFVNRYTVRFDDEQNEYIKSKAKEAGISELTYFRLLIAKEMRGEKNGYNEQKYKN